MAPAAVRELAIWANGHRVGSWRLSSRARMEFQYDVHWVSLPEARPLSLSLPMPIGNAPHVGARVDAYFDNLLPESDAIRRRIQERFHTATRASFDLLAAIGRDCVGAVQIVPADETPARIDDIQATALTPKQVADEIAQVTSPGPLGRNDKDFRISIAGAQEKTAFLKHKGQWCRPSGSTPTTHIFKLPLGSVSQYQADMSTSVENEWLCARIAAGFGLPVAACEMAEFGAQKVLIVERFDRQLHSSGRYWLRLMQEDFAQATGTPWHRKYQADGGPGILAIGEILRGSIEARRDLETLFRAQLLFHLLAAIDGHAKNFSIRLLAGDRFELTPLYDVLSAWPVIGRRSREIPMEKVNMAMALPGERPRYRLNSIQRRHFETLGAKLALGKDVARLIDDMVARTPAVLEQVASQLPKAFPASLFERISHAMRKQAIALTTRRAPA